LYFSILNIGKKHRIYLLSSTIINKKRKKRIITRGDAGVVDFIRAFITIMESRNGV